MPLSPGRRLGPYEILAPVGAGGMGEVYRARDTRLDRTVAIKVLPAHVAERPEARQRFEREARAVSSLNHPHICTLYDIGQQDGIDFLVMEYLEGETLARRLARGPLPLDQVLRHALAMADALSQAHRQGVFHRDLKPGNIMLTKSGAKLLDFGLAKVGLRSPGTADGATESGDLTEKGTILGMLHYMAPEQVEGKPTDGRSDIFSFGAVIYEMVTGRKAFAGTSQASVIAGILTADPPPMSKLQALAPPLLDHIVGTCLAKDPDERWQAAGDLKRELQWVSEGVAAPSPPAVAVRRQRLPWILVGALGLILLVVLALWPRSSPDSNAVRFSIYPPEKGAFTSPPATVPATQLAISPDGRRVAFIASSGDSPPMLWIRPLEETTAKPLAGTEDAGYPFWSPDSREVGFFARGKLKRIHVTGGPPQTLSESVADPRGGSWNADGVILFANAFEAIHRISAVGGPATVVTKLDPSRQEITHRWPQFLPDGRHFLYHVRTPAVDHRGIYVGSLDGKSPKLLLHFAHSDSSAAYAPPGYLLFLDGTTLMAHPFDLDRLGSPIPVAQPVGGTTTGYSAFSVSHNGALAYDSGVAPAGRLTWTDRSGKPLTSIEPPGDYIDFRPSPDERFVAATRVDPKTNQPDIWLLDLARGTNSRFTSGPLLDATPLWSPDGESIIFRSNKGGVTELYQKRATTGSAEELLYGIEQQRTSLGVPNPILGDWSSDGRFLVFLSGAFDIWVMPLAGDRKPFVVVRSPFMEMHANFSPDGRWLAYASDETGRFEVYVQAFLGPNGAPLSGPGGGKSMVSANGGSQPRWRRDGKELYYVAPDRRLMSVPVNATSSLQPGVPQPLFPLRIPPGVNPYRLHYFPAADGRRFLVNTLLEEAVPSPITVVLNWTAGLKR